MTGSPASYPPPEAVAQMYTLAVLPRKVERLLTRVWTDVKAGTVTIRYSTLPPVAGRGPHRSSVEPRIVVETWS